MLACWSEPGFRLPRHPRCFPGRHSTATPTFTKSSCKECDLCPLWLKLCCISTIYFLFVPSLNSKSASVDTNNSEQYPVFFSIPKSQPNDPVREVRVNCGSKKKDLSHYVQTFVLFTCSANHTPLSYIVFSHAWLRSWSLMALWQVAALPQQNSTGVFPSMSPSNTFKHCRTRCIMAEVSVLINSCQFLDRQDQGVWRI